MEFDSKFLDSTSQFTGDLYQQTIEGISGNVVVSPVSILTGLTLLMFGASGRTSSQIKSSLKFDEILNEDLEKNFQRITENFEGSRVSMANKIYLMKNYSVKLKFKEIAVKSFHSQVESIDFGKNVEAANKINEWVESKTNNKIKNLIKADYLNSNTQLVLANGIHFKTYWKRPVKLEENSKDSFYLNEEKTVDVEYISQKDTLNYAVFSELDATAVELQFWNSKATMMIILPNSRTGLSALESKLKDVNFNDLSKRMFQRSVYVTIPKFKIEYDVNLEESLKKMGMERIFSLDSEFDNLLESPKPIKVSKMIHKAIFEVTENANEVAVGPGLLLMNRIPLPPVHFKADHPFMFALIEDSNVLFIGRKVQ